MVSLLACLMSGFLGISAITLSNNGVTQYQIVHPDTITEGDKFLLKDFQNLLRYATKAKFNTVKQSAQPAAKRIYVGIAPAGYDVKSLKPQEHVVKTVGDDLYLFGGGQNGAKYAVYDLLQNVMGYRFFDVRGGMKIPEKKVWTLPDLDRRTQFDFWIRRTTKYWLFYYPYCLYFQYRNAQNNWVHPTFEQRGLKINKDDFFHNYTLSHTLHKYLPPDGKTAAIDWIKKLNVNLWKEHPEYFSMGPDGKRRNDHQYCMSNPGLRKLLAERVLENIRRNPQNDSFSIACRDTPGRFCYCKDCLALEKKHGAIGGPLFDFLIWFCPIVEKKYPGKLITTLVYRKDQTQHPPKNIKRFPDNLGIIFCPIDDNFSKDWTHPDNQATYEDLKEWRKKVNHLFMWYYTNVYTSRIHMPLGNVEKMITDTRLMKAAGVDGMFWEHDIGVPEMIGFTELQSYVALQLFQKVDQDEKKLIREFMEYEYGKAADMMIAYLEELESLRKNTKFFLNWNANANAYTYVTPERLMKWDMQFDLMERILAGDKARLENLSRVRICVDLAILRQYPGVKKYAPAYPLTPEQLAEKITKVYGQAIRKYIHLEFRYQEYKKKLDDLLSSLLIECGGGKPLPKEIFGKIPENRLFSFIPTVPGQTLEKDPDAAFGKRAYFHKFVSKRKDPLPFSSNIQDFTGKFSYRTNLGRVDRNNLGPRGKYKFYNMGSAEITQDCILRVGEGWFDLKTRIGRAYVAGTFNRATFYMSLKFEGEGFYPEDKGKPNKVYCDRVVVVREQD